MASPSRPLSSVYLCSEAPFGKAANLRELVRSVGCIEALPASESLPPGPSGWVSRENGLHPPFS